METLFLATEPMQAAAIFDLLRQSLLLFMRMYVHRRAGEEEEQGEWFGVEVGKVLGWCERVLVPALSDKTS